MLYYYSRNYGFSQNELQHSCSFISCNISDYWHLVVQKINGLNYLKGTEKTDKKIAVYYLHISKTQRYKYQQYNNNTNVGVENLHASSEKIDIITYNNTRYIHRQIEKRNNLWFMRLKIRLMNHFEK